MPTAGNVIDTSAVLPAASDTVTVALAVPASAVSGVPPITPVPASMLNPDGSPVALYSSMPPPVGLIAVIAAIDAPTCSEPDGVYVVPAGVVFASAFPAGPAARGKGKRDRGVEGPQIAAGNRHVVLRGSPDTAATVGAAVVPDIAKSAASTF